MSYIINNTSAFVNIKLTEIGRQKIAQGQLTFNSWAIGDSEINYDREVNHDNFPMDVSLSGSSKVLRPFDNQPNLKYFITSQNTSEGGLNVLNTSQINTIKAIVNNKAEDRGFFEKVGSDYVTYSGDTYIKGGGIIPGPNMDGSNILVIGTGYTVGDVILVKVSNDTVGTLPLNQNTTPVPNLWYKIQSLTTTNDVNDTAILDRNLPNTNSSISDSQFIVYTGGEVYGNFGFEETTPYWNSNTLSFAGSSEISSGDVAVWNMNNVWCENLVGMTGTSVNNSVSTPNENFSKFGSNGFLGQKYPYLGYSCNENSGANSGVLDECNSLGQSVKDRTKKSISILHYTNNTISNFYGEYLFIDGDKNKNLILRLPDIMYHRRDFTSENGTLMGMDFIASGDTKFIDNSDIKYIELVEYGTLVSGTPRVVGKVFPQLKTVIFDDDEIIAAMSYKSNRNWTLPSLSANLITSNLGSGSGVLAAKKTMYITYSFENSTTNGLGTTLPCQSYAKIYNSTSSSKDVQFKLNDIDLLPYMRKEEKVGYDGLGFSAREFKVLYQIVDDVTDRPKSDAWKVYDYTNTNITDAVGETIDPIKLENQNPTVNGFLIDSVVDTSATIFSIMTSLNMPANTTPEVLQFGDERFFYGNLETYIGATIYKSIFNIDISADDFKTTGNPSRSNAAVNPPDIRVTEVGIYDNTGDLVMIGKLSKPVKLTSGNTIMVELSIDF